MRHLDYRMSKALQEERLVRARQPTSRQHPRERGNSPGRLLRARQHLGRLMMVFGRHLAAEEVEAH